MISFFSGLMMGSLHVWSGPDHLAAIAPLAAQQPRRSWLPGVRWGLGHSAGVALVGLLALILKDLLPMDRISGWSEWLVGVLLIGIGLWGWRKVLQQRVHVHAHQHDGEPHTHVHVHAKPHAAPKPDVPAHHHTHAALGIGILHGLAGSSHLLGVLPMLAMRTKFDSALYLAAFALGTIFSMGAFSAIIGALASRCAIAGDKAYRGIMATCATAAILVGIVWLVLSMSTKA